MRVVYLCQELGQSSPGGIATYTDIVAEAMAQRGHAVTVISREAAFNRTVRPRGYDILWLKPTYVGNFTHHLEYSYAVFQAIKALVQPPELIEAPDWCAEAFFCVAERTIPLITRLHTPSILVSESNGALYQNDRLLDTLERQQTLLSTAVTAPSHAIVNRLQKPWGLDPQRVSIIPNPIVPSPPIPAAPSARGRRYLLFLGRLEPRKGILILAQAIPKILAEHPDLEIVFCGQNTIFRHRSIWKEVCAAAGLYQSRIQHVGYLHGAEKQMLVQGAQAVVIPSIWENFPYTALEALDAGVPVISTYGSGVAEIVESGVNGLLVPPGDANALVEAVLSLLEGEEVARMRTQARRSVLRFAVEQVLPSIEQLYRSLM